MQEYFTKEEWDIITGSIMTAFVSLFQIIHTKATVLTLGTKIWATMLLFSKSNGHYSNAPDFLFLKVKGQYRLIDQKRGCFEYQHRQHLRGFFNKDDFTLIFSLILERLVELGFHISICAPVNYTYYYQVAMGSNKLLGWHGLQIIKHKEFYYLIKSTPKGMYIMV